MDNKLISKTVLAGLVIAAVAIGLFLVLWFTLTSFEPLLRLSLSVCVPPVLMSAIIGVYLLTTRRRTPDPSASTPHDETQP